MIFSIVENVSKDDKVQKCIIKGKNEEVAAELENIMTELIERGFPEDLIMSVMYEVLHNTRIVARR